MVAYIATPPIPIPILEFPTLILLLGSFGYEAIKGYRQIKMQKVGVAKAQAFRSPNGVDVEIGLTEKGELQVCVDEDELRAKEGIEREELAEQIIQAYTYKKVVEKLEKQGYSVIEEQEVDSGTIKLVVQKWS